MNRKISRTVEGDISAQCDTRLVAMATYVPIYARGMKSGIIATLLLAFGIFVFVRSIEPSSPGTVGPPPDEPAEISSEIPPNMEVNEIIGRGRQPESIGPGTEPPK